MRWLVFLALAACYHPSKIDPCAISCADETECPSGFGCNGITCTFANGGCDSPDLDADPAGEPTMSCAGAQDGLLSTLCFGRQSDPTTILGGSINTTDDSRCLDINGNCVIVANEIVVADLFAATGTRPLVLWSASTITVLGTLDVSSRRFDLPQVGAGADPGANCPTSNDGMAVDSGAGGGGGSFAASGGLGGLGHNASGFTQPGQLQPVVARAELTLRGGCQGGVGGLDMAQGNHGGGAVYLMARDLIKISSPGGMPLATINANGAGGEGGAGLVAGGGGGGSGGLIGLDAPAITLDHALLLAMGGGGGGGASDTSLGDPGQNGDSTGLITAAPGGASTIANNTGGQGGDSNNAPGFPGDDADGALKGGGGGGGGGPGFIIFVGGAPTRTNTVIAPVIPPAVAR